jgi:hypothetical protein
MDKEIFSPQESLQVIQSMIDKAKNSVADKSFYFLLWGWLVFIGALLQFTLKDFVRTNAHPAAWNIMFLGLILSFLHGIKQRKKERIVKTYIDETLRNIWITISICQGLIVFIFMRRGGWENCYTFFILLYSIGCFLTGRTLKFLPLIWGAVVCWALVIVSTFTNMDANMLIMAFAILVSYIIPGYLLRRQHLKTINVS